MYTPQFSDKATITVRRLAWALSEISDNAHYPRRIIIRGKCCKLQHIQDLAKNISDNYNGKFSL
jgi:hypothetical protein